MQLSRIFTDCRAVNKLIGLIKHPESGAVCGGRSLRQREERTAEEEAETEEVERSGSGGRDLGETGQDSI